MQNRPEIDLLKEQYKEEIGVSEVLSEEIKLFLDFYGEKQDTIRKAREKVDLEVEKIKGIKELSYVVLMGSNSALLDTLFRVQSDITETPEDEVRRMASEKFEKSSRK